MAFPVMGPTAIDTPAVSWSPLLLVCLAWGTSFMSPSQTASGLSCPSSAFCGFICCCLSGSQGWQASWGSSERVGPLLGVAVPTPQPPSAACPLSSYLVPKSSSCCEVLGNSAHSIARGGSWGLVAFDWGQLWVFSGCSAAGLLALGTPSTPRPPAVGLGHSRLQRLPLGIPVLFPGCLLCPSCSGSAPQHPPPLCLAVPSVGCWACLLDQEVSVFVFSGIWTP